MDRGKNINLVLKFLKENLNGERWNGEGLEFGFNANITFEGEYVNGKRYEKENKK